MDNTSKSRRGLCYQAGDKYGMVTLTGKCYMAGAGKRMVEYIFECGNTNWGSLSRLIKGVFKSCGCLSKKSLDEGRISHGLCYHKLYKLWSDMVQRCHNENSDSYYNYGERGITVCEEWRANAGEFIKWAEANGWRHGVGLTLERDNNDLGYSPSNCSWQTRKTQARNRRNNVFFTLLGETKCLFDWSVDERCDVKQNTIMYRIKKLGWSVEDAILTPSKRK